MRNHRTKAQVTIGSGLIYLLYVLVVALFSYDLFCAVYWREESFQVSSNPHEHITMVRLCFRIAIDIFGIFVIARRIILTSSKRRGLRGGLEENK